MSDNLYSIPVKRIDGTPATLGEYEGSVLLIVNVASKCGLTPQYEGLQKLYSTYHAKGFEVLGFPANEFGAQEPGTNDEIQEFCTTNYQVAFPMFEKVVVKGDGQHPLYKKLIDEQPKADSKTESELRATLNKYGMGPTNDRDIMWNFEKFLVDRHGEVIGRFAPDIAPNEPPICHAIETALAG